MSGITTMPHISTQLTAMTTFAQSPASGIAWLAVRQHVLDPLDLYQGEIAGRPSVTAGEGDFAGFKDSVVGQVRPRLDARLFEYSAAYRAGSEVHQDPRSFVRLISEARELDIISSRPAEAMLASARLVHPDLAEAKDRDQARHYSSLDKGILNKDFKKVCRGVAVAAFSYLYLQMFFSLGLHMSAVEFSFPAGLVELSGDSPVTLEHVKEWLGFCPHKHILSSGIVGFIFSAIGEERPPRL